MPLHVLGSTRPLAARCPNTHLNNGAPLVDPAAPPHERLTGPGIEEAYDGMVIEW